MSFQDSNCILVKNPKIIPKLSEVLELLFKKAQSSSCKVVQDEYYFNGTSKKSCTFGKKCVNLINECLLNHRFDEATKLLWIMYQDRTCFNFLLYKGIMVVLENLSSGDILTVNRISRNIRKLDYVNKLDIELEYLIYALKNDIYGGEDSFYLEGMNATKGRIKIIPHIEQIYSAYCALLKYIVWVNKISQSVELCQDENDTAFSVISSFKKLIDNPGIWDIFVLKLIEMLEYYKQYDEIEEVLKKYVEVNPQHINAYIYLCEHLHKHNSDPNTLIHYAKILADLCPSDERVLLLAQIWNELGNNLKKCLRILFMYLDYPVNGRKILGWQLLFSLLQQAVSSKKSSSIKAVNSFWNSRSSSWNYMYFKTSSICTETVELVSCKVDILSVLQSDHEYIMHAQETFPSINNKRLI